MLTRSIRSSISLHLSSAKARSLMPLSTLSNASRPANWKNVAPSPLTPGLTFSAQDKLPRLPVPDLQPTLDQLKETLRPIAHTQTELDAVFKKIDEFGVNDGPGLQEKLKQRASETDHWLEAWWDDLGYMGYRDSVVINVSYYYGFEAQPSHLGQDAASRAASIARGALLFRQQLKQGKIKPDGTKEGPFCMDTYRWMFDCCRIPGLEGLDWAVSHSKETDDGASGHIIFIRKNRLWKVDASKDGRLLSTSELVSQIQHIYDNTQGEYPGVGVLASNNRDVWAKDYAKLLTSSKNTSILDEINSSAFIISLEESPSDSKFAHSGPSAPTAFSRALWHGDISADGKATGLRNRWVDKPIQFLVYDNGAAGLMGEHSVMDGTPPQRLCDDILAGLRSPYFDHGEHSEQALPKPVPLDWEIVPGLENAIEEADKAAVELIDGHALNFLRTDYGKATIKKLGVSPDSWAQMIVQLAHWRLLAETGDKPYGATYEAATTRKFLKGRTEAIRVVSTVSDTWVKSMDDPSVGKAQRLELFQKASKVHIGRAKEAGNGKGIDRHLLGLKLLVDPKGPMPALFSDPVYKRSSYWCLSTSAINSNYFETYGWGECPSRFVPDGLECLMQLPRMTTSSIPITSRREMPNAKFIQEISQASRDYVRPSGRNFEIVATIIVWYLC
ncbi:acyltransferase ChoActase/COT/CPT [Flagelloscypha sp. PMI_526]|nr:acyltransferase ChoActase/COT/CPT [Flagelloscypha sp. PMI_526]